MNPTTRHQVFFKSPFNGRFYKHYHGIFEDAPLVYFNADLTSLILPYLDWPSLVALSQTDCAGRSMAREEFRSRMKMLLRRFLPESGFDDFIDMLERTGSAIVGGIPFYATTLNLFSVVHRMRHNTSFAMELFDTNLLIPLDQWGEVVQWFVDMGCGEFRTHVVAPAYRKSVLVFMTTSFSSDGPRGRRKVSLAPKVESEYTNFAEQDAITLSACSSSLVDVALLAPWSTQTNIITASSFISFFPIANLYRLVMRNGNDTKWLTVPDAQWITYSRASSSRMPCRHLCMSLKPNWPQYTTIQSFKWRDSDSDDLVDEARHTTGPLAYTPRCYNRFCHFYTSPFLRT